MQTKTESDGRGTEKHLAVPVHHLNPNLFRRLKPPKTPCEGQGQVDVTTIIRSYTERASAVDTVILDKKRN